MLALMTILPRRELAVRACFSRARTFGNSVLRLSQLFIAVVAVVLAVSTNASAAETIPAKPTRYFNDYALTVKAGDR